MVTMTVDGKDYQLVCTTKVLMNMEEKLGTNPLNILIRMRLNNELPKISEIVTILHFLLQKMNHGISFVDTIDLFNNYCEETPNGMITVMELFMKVFEEAGVISIEEDEDPNL